MFPNLRAELARKKINRTNFAKELGVLEITINSKIQGKNPFKLEEMIKIKEFLGVDMPLEELFRKEEYETKPRPQMLKRQKIQKREGKYRQVRQYDIEGNLIKTWDSTIDASKELGLSKANILSVCNKTRKTVGGFVWRWVYENIDEE